MEFHLGGVSGTTDLYSQYPNGYPGKIYTVYAGLLGLCGLRFPLGTYKTFPSATPDRIYKETLWEIVSSLDWEVRMLGLAGSHTQRSTYSAEGRLVEEGSG